MEGCKSSKDNAGTDYSEDDDFYSQDFRRQGLVSVWLALPDFDTSGKRDALQDCCGVGYYSVDDGEANGAGGEAVPVAELLAPISYSQSFSRSIIAAAKAMDIDSSSWILVQFDFQYDAAKVSRPIDAKLQYIGAFPYQID